MQAFNAVSAICDADFSISGAMMQVNSAYMKLVANDSVAEVRRY